jgi:F-type H+-transporting ATPase subunit a
MNGAEILEPKQLNLFSAFNVTHPFWYVNYDTILYTWVVLIILLVVAVPVSVLLRNKSGKLRYFFTHYVRFFIDLVTQTLGYFSYKHTVFITALFTFIFLCNCIPVIPWLEEPTKDINTAIAFGLISFFYIQFYAVKAHGFKEYLREYFSPFFLMFPLHVISKLASIVSISFRLWGNIFGGALIMYIYLSRIQGSLIAESINLVSGINLILSLFFGLFEGFLQAFVFTMLSVTYLSIALAPPEGEELAHE